MPILIIAGAIVITLAAIIIIFIPRPAVTPKTVANLNELEDHLENLVQSGYPEGLSLAVVKDGKTVYAKGFGMADRPNSKLSTADTVYNWWSVTKIFTATAVMQLHEKGLLNLDDKIEDHLSFFKVEDPFDSDEIITIRHLLNHSSGLPDNTPAVFGWMHFDGEAEKDQTEIVKKYFKDYSKLKFKTGAFSRYTNFGYSILGAVIEKVSGEKYNDYIRNHILKPLKMEQTDFYLSEEMRLKAAAGMHPVVDLVSVILPFFYGKRFSKLLRETRKGKMWFNPIYADSSPPTGLMGNVTDMTRFAAAYLNGEELDSIRILSKESVDSMTNDSHINIDGEQYQKNDQRGLGWVVNSNENNLCLAHGGGGAGFGSLLTLYPDKSLAVILVSNYTNFDSIGITKLVKRLDW